MVHAADPSPARSLAVTAALLLAPIGSGCGSPESGDARLVTVPGGDAVRGARLLSQYQCGSCHAIPDVAGSQGRVGPTLAGLHRRSYLAGQVPNTPALLVRWLQAPQALVPGTTMPDMGVPEADARDMAAHLLRTPR